MYGAGDNRSDDDDAAVSVPRDQALRVFVLPTFAAVTTVVLLGISADTGQVVFLAAEPA